MSALAEEILIEGEGQIKAIVLGAGNPILTTPNGPQLDKAFERLDFVVAVDVYITESSRHADIMLPPVTALERDHYDVIFHNFAVLQFRWIGDIFREQPRTNLQVSEYPVARGVLHVEQARTTPNIPFCSFAVS